MVVWRLRECPVVVAVFGVASGAFGSVGCVGTVGGFLDAAVVVLVSSFAQQVLCWWFRRLFLVAVKRS